MIEVLKQALDALEKVKRRAVVMGSTGDYREGQLDALKAVSEDVKPAIASLRQAIAKLESQEPVAWMYDWTTSEGEFLQNWTTSEAETLRDTEPTIITNVRPLYATPQPCPTCEALARTVMMDQTGRDL